jgi:hypothetical protein
MIIRFLLIWLIFVAAAFGSGLAMYHNYLDANKKVAQLGPFNPFGPRPPRPRPDPEPPPAPLEESDARLFARLRLHIEKAADERASKKIEAAFDEATRKIEQTNPDGSMVVTDEPSQFIGTSLFASALVGFIWKAVKFVVMAVVGSCIIALFWMYWQWIAIGFTVAVTVICWPIAFAAAKLAQPSKEK